MSEPVATHGPSQIVQKVFIALGLGTQPASGAVWPIYVTSEPDVPDNVITIYDTQGTPQGRAMVTGEIEENHGIQVRLRSTTVQVGRPKLEAIRRAMAMSVYDETVTIDSKIYLLHAFARIGQIIDLGKDATSKRSLFTLNTELTLRVLV